MGRVQDIITRVRDTLADPSGDRWPDDRLLRLLDEGQTTIARKSKVLKGRENIIITNGDYNIKLPDDLVLLDRVTFNGIKLEYKSYSQMDNIKYDWELDIGVPKYAIFDKDNRNNLRLYPIPLNLEPTDFEPFGVIVDSITPFGTVVDTEELIANEDIDIYGITTYISSFTVVIKYIKLPRKIVTIANTLELSTVFDKALKHYIVGCALHEDMDTQNRTAGNEELQLYYSELDIAINENSLDFIGSTRRYETKYEVGI